MFLVNLILDFCVSLGMVVGGSILGGMGAFIMHKPPMLMMIRLSDQLKIWAMVSALGGTMDTLRVISTGFIYLQLDPIARQFCYLIAAFVGCQVGALMIQWLSGSHRP